MNESKPLLSIIKYSEKEYKKATLDQATKLLETYRQNLIAVMKVAKVSVQGDQYYFDASKLVHEVLRMLKACFLWWEAIVKIDTKNSFEMENRQFLRNVGMAEHKGFGDAIQTIARIYIAHYKAKNTVEPNEEIDRAINEALKQYVFIRNTMDQFFDCFSQAIESTTTPAGILLVKNIWSPVSQIVQRMILSTAKRVQPIQSSNLRHASGIDVDWIDDQLLMAPIQLKENSGNHILGGINKFFSKSSTEQQSSQPSLIDLGFFNLAFRETWKEHLTSRGVPQICPYVDFIIDITKFKCVFEGNMPIPSKKAITADIYRMVNVGNKKISIRKAKIFNEGDPRFSEAKSRALKILAKYCVTNSPNHITFSEKYRDKLQRPVTNRISNSYFDKALALVWTTLESEVTKFLVSVERLSYEENRALTHDIIRIDHKLTEVDSSMSNKHDESKILSQQKMTLENYNTTKVQTHDTARIENKLVEVDSSMSNNKQVIQILQQQKVNLDNLHESKVLAAKRHRPKTTYICGFENFSSMIKYWETIPIKKIEFTEPNDLICYMKGEEGSETGMVYSDIARGGLISTFPLKNSTTRLGDPICDTFRLYLTPAYGIIIAAAGCNWEKASFEAAQNASNGFVDYVKENIPSIQNLQRLGQLMIQGVEAAHYAVLAPTNYNINVSSSNEVENWDVGTSTLVAAVMAQTQSGEIELLCVNVGDCKLMVYRDGKVIDVTAGARGNLTDTLDPGGCLGPQLRLGRPDLRNLSLVTFSCQEGDLLFAITDGIHDNFDPQQLGLSPRLLGIDADDWRTAETLFNTITTEKKGEFMTNKMQEVISNQAQVYRSAANPSIITRALTQYSIDLSQGSRVWMENHPGKKLPEDYSLYPGTMDHGACICTKVMSAKTPSPITRSPDVQPELPLETAEPISELHET